MMERFDKILNYITSITTWKQVFIVIVLGAAILVGTLIYQHTYWIENYWRYLHGLPMDRHP